MYRIERNDEIETPCDSMNHAEASQRAHSKGGLAMRELERTGRARQGQYRLARGALERQEVAEKVAA